MSSHRTPCVVEYGMVILLSVPLHVNISSGYRKLPPLTSSTVKLSHSSSGGMVWANPLRQGSFAVIRKYKVQYQNKYIFYSYYMCSNTVCYTRDYIEEVNSTIIIV